MNTTEAIDAIENGATTINDVADAVGRDYGHVARVLKDLAEDPTSPITRERDGRSYRYAVAEAAQAPTPTPDATGIDDETGVMTAVRDYDWSTLVPTDVPEYVAHNGEWEEINAMVDARETTGMAHVVLGGPTGCGKTHLAERLAFERGLPLFTIQGKYSLNESKLLGSPSISPDGSTVWVDGTLTKAVMASAERPVVLLLDEVNRARPEAKSVLFSALDHRCTVVLDGERGGEQIVGKAENLIVVATMNEGRGHFVQELDAAEKRRLGPRFDVDYLGVSYPDREAGLIVERTPVGQNLAGMLVKTANEVRALATDMDSNVQLGIPTATLLDWANQAWSYAQAGVSDPVVKAGEAAVVRMFYSDSPGASKVSQTIQANLAGCPVDESDAAAFRDGDAEVYACDSCGWTFVDSGEGDLPESVENWSECPECEHVPVEATTRDI